MTKPRLTQCKQGHDLTLPNAVYTSAKARRCRVCWLDYQRTLQRVKRGTPLDAPVRAYIKVSPRRPRPTLELIKLVSANPELAKSLLSIADGWGIRKKDLV
jgi:hypothetical protein